MSRDKLRSQNVIRSQSRQISWNTLQLSLPPDWDVIVSAPRHLLIEQDFKPVVEIRWESDRSACIEQVVKSLRRAVPKSYREKICEVPLPAEFIPLKKAKNATGLSWSGDTGLNCLFWKCENSNSTIICRLFNDCKVGLSSIRDLLMGITFPNSINDSQLWAIQDITISLPSVFQFRDYTFAPGLTRLAFHSTQIHLQVCRLAPARERLAAHSLRDILENLQGETLADTILQNQPAVFETVTYPSLWQQMRMRLKRSKPFQWGKIWHVEESNRILAVTAESIRPIELDTVHKICKQYEIS